MTNKILEAKKKIKAKKSSKTKGTLTAMGDGMGNRTAGKIMTSEGEKGKMNY